MPTPRWLLWCNNGQCWRDEWPQGVSVLGLATRLSNAQWFWFEAEWYGFEDGMPVGKQTADGLIQPLPGVQTSDEEMERIRADTARETGPPLP